MHASKWEIQIEMTKMKLMTIKYYLEIGICELQKAPASLFWNLIYKNSLTFETTFCIIIWKKSMVVILLV